MSIKSVLRQIVNPALRPVARRFTNLTDVPRAVESHEARLRLLAGREAREQYAQLLPQSTPASGLHRHEFSVFSQHGEDGILLEIFSQIGVTNRRFVEFGVEDGTECNAANLAINFGFSGLMMDGSEANVRRGRQFYDATLGPRAADVTIVPSWITAENINETLARNGATGDIDLLSIDIDGNDYWVWQAISAVNPRVIVAEYNAGFGSHRSVTIPYAADFDRWRAHPSGFYFGASLAALTKLADSKGYFFIGCESGGANAFYVREDLAIGTFSPVSVEEAFVSQSNRVLRGYSQIEQEHMVYSLPVKDV